MYCSPQRRGSGLNHTTFSDGGTVPAMMANSRWAELSVRKQSPVTRSWHDGWWLTGDTLLTDWQYNGSIMTLKDWGKNGWIYFWGVENSTEIWEEFQDYDALFGRCHQTEHICMGEQRNLSTQPKQLETYLHKMSFIFTAKMTFPKTICSQFWGQKWFGPSCRKRGQEWPRGARIQPFKKYLPTPRF